MKNAAVETLSYAFDDWAIGNVAKFLNQSSKAEDYYNRSKWYKNVFSNESKFFCPKNISNMKFHCPQGIELLNPFDNRYTEGDAWHYRFFVPQDPEGLIELFGGNSKFVE